MLAVLYLLFFLAGGVLITHFWLPSRSTPVRWYLGAALGLFLLMWLPALWAYAVTFSLPAHSLAAGTLCLLVLGAFLTRVYNQPFWPNLPDKRALRLLLFVALPLTLLAGYLEYTHSIRPAWDGYHVGQSTYGDLSLHLAVATSAVNAPFPLQNSLMIGATMAYPYLSDTFATSMYMLGMSLPMAMAFTGTVMCALVFAGYTLLAAALCRKRGAAALAVLLLFANGGLGFFYTLSGTVENGVKTTLMDNLHTVITGYYKTPTNQPDDNLRWVNIICDMLIPQRGFLGGWSMLMPVFLLVLPHTLRGYCVNDIENLFDGSQVATLRKFAGPTPRRGFDLSFGRHCRTTRVLYSLNRLRIPVLQNAPREMILAGLIAGGLPLLHTHSFLALGLASIGFCAYAVLEAPKGRRFQTFKPFLWYGVIAAALALPQLLNLTFKQAISSDHFLRFQFNWCNNRGGAGLVEPYFWFYFKNIGIPYLLIVLALFERKLPQAAQPCGDGKAESAVDAGTVSAETEAASPDETSADDLPYAADTQELEEVSTHNAAVRQHRLIAAGAFLILLIAEFIIFQPNEYDNNKLIYVWFLLLLPMAADYAVTLYERLRGVGGRRVLAALVLIACFLSAGLTIARECVSDYQAYPNEDIAAADYILANTPEHSVFLTGTQHLNPAASLAGRTLVCGSDLYLYFHGFNTTQRKAELEAFYEDPAAHLALLAKYGVSYIFVSNYERSEYILDEAALDSLFTRVYESASGRVVIWAVAAPAETSAL